MNNEQPAAIPVAASASSARAKVKTLACLGGISLERGVSMDEVQGYVKDPTNIVWVDIQDAGPEEFSMLLEEFGFHPLALEDVAKGQQRPKVDEYKGYLFVVIYSATRRSETGEFSTQEVGLFIGRNYLVSLHKGPLAALDDAMNRWARGGQMLNEGIGFLTYTVVDAVIDTYFPVINGIEDELEASEMQMFDQTQHFGVERLVRYKRTLVALRRVLSPLREVFNVFLRRDHPYFSTNTLAYFQNVYDHVLRLLDALDTEREMLAAALDAHLAVVSNRVNATMKTLTVITVVVAFAGSVFGAWGMNFSNIPLAEHPLGFWVVWFGTMILMGLALLYSWTRKWL
ncbi:MAG: magnesium/cobalt transporter CorA [Pirellulaceae bacterium]|nr:magnesium/cobalt transporter CorA [Pirellulaceae bacterium]